MNTSIKTVALIILDGWGINDSDEANAISHANTPVWDALTASSPMSEIITSGEKVGLPEGQVGNSEVGHMSIGAGRTIYQNLTLINQAIKDKSFFDNPELVASINRAKKDNSALHILGLLSDGGVHSHTHHIESMCEMAAKQGLKKIYVHAFLDGRDTPPRSAKKPIQQLENTLDRLKCGRIASVIGRYFAMDRDDRWDRTEAAYKLITQGKGLANASSASAAINLAYSHNVNDEFCPPTVITQAGEEAITIDSQDQIIFMNFRPDRARQLTRALTESDFTHFNRPVKPANGNVVTLTQYAADLNAHCAYPPKVITNSLGEYLSGLNRKQLRIAETEKYAHVTFFFNGGREDKFPGESRILVPSPDVATYDLKPEMSAPEVTEKLIDAIHSKAFDLIVCNFANGDMVGHTGNFEAAVKAVEVLDKCLGKIITAIKESDSIALISADHGNVEKMQDNGSGQAYTAHTSYPVPLVYVANHTDGISLKNGSLIDLAPTILEIMSLPAPKEMTGCSLIK